MRKSGFNVGLIVISNILIIIISLSYGLRVNPGSYLPTQKALASNEAVEEFKDLTIKKQG